MAEDADPKASAAYRELGAQEPPRALDEAILAASRRAAPSLTGRPAKSRLSRWAVPLSLAAVVVLSVVVTLRIQHEAPGIESEQTLPAATSAPARVAEAPPPAPKAEAPRKPLAQPTAKAQARQEARRDEPKALPDAAADRAPAGEAAARPAPAAGALARSTAKLEVESPERELERIAQLRAEGKHDEADKALAEFRKRFPGFKIPAAMVERVERLP